MATRRILRPWTSQPTHVTGVNRGHPATADLSFLFSGAAGVNAVDPAGARIRAGDNVMQPGPGGTGFLTNDSGYWSFSGTQINRNPNELTMLCVFAFTRNTNYDAIKMHSGRTWTTNVLSVEAYYSGGNIKCAGTGGSELDLGASAGLWNANTFWVVWDGTSIRACANGRADVTGSRSAFNIQDNPQSVTLGCNNNVGLGITRGSNTYLAAVWNRALSRPERDAIGGNPWVLFEPRQIVVPRAAAGGYTHPTLSNARMVWTGPGAGKPAIDYTW